MSSSKPDKSKFWDVAPYQKHSAEEVAETQRRRLLLGVTRAVARLGYAACRVADIIEEVRVSRRTFYEMFEDKDACFLAAYEVVHQSVIEAVKQSQRGITDALARVEQAHRTYLEVTRQEPEVSSAFLVGILEAGPQVTERRQRAYAEFAQMHAVLHKQCRIQHPELPEVPQAAFVALTTGTNIILIDELRKHGPEKLMDLLPTVLYLSYSVYGLHRQAAAVIAPAPPAPRRRTAR